jgi:hypothetical protein
MAFYADRSMKTKSDNGQERPNAPAEAGGDLVWKPSSGEGSAAALHSLRRAERVRNVWRQVRTGTGRSTKHDGPNSA